MAAKLNAKIISSLEKCFHDEALSDHPRLKKASMLRNERYSFQLAMQLQDRTCKDKKEVYLRVKSALAAYLEVKLVREVPSMFPCYGAPAGGSTCAAHRGFIRICWSRWQRAGRFRSCRASCAAFGLR